MPNVEFVVTAEFHVDKGPQLTLQHPTELPGIQDLLFLPELMLPDQIHKRTEDYTLFLLHKNKSTGRFQYKYDAACDGDPRFLYSVVSQQKLHDVRRGAVIKALAIVTTLPYFKNFKPLLLLCLDRLFAESSRTVVAELYAAINGKNLVPAQLVPDVRKLLITSILDLPINEKLYSDVHFRNRLLGIRKGNPDLHMRKDLSYNVVVSFNGMQIPVRVPMLTFSDTVGDYFNPTDLNLKANLLALLSALSATLHHHNEMTIYGPLTPPIIVLVNALLTGKRIMFLSYKSPAGHIIDCVLLALKLVTGGGILTGFLTSFNIFPMVDVSKVDLLEQCSSFLAGTINPFFKQHDRLWDLLWDLDANEFHVSQHISQPDVPKSSIVSEDAKFLSHLQHSLFNYNDDLTTLQLIFRRHINEIVRMMLSLRNVGLHDRNLTLLMDGVGYFWHLDTIKLLEITCYQAIATKFQARMYSGHVAYTLLFVHLPNELNLVVDLQHQMQKLNNVATARIDERVIWCNILKYLIGSRSLETFLLVTYLIPPNSSTSLQSSSSHGGNLTIFDKNKGIELLLLNLFNEDRQIKSYVVLILQELQENTLCGWCLNNYFKSNYIYEVAFKALTATDKR